MKRYISIFVALIFSAFTLTAQVKMELEVPQTVDISEDYFQIKFVVSDVNASNFTPPSLQDFELLSGPYSSVMSSTSIINGKSHHEGSTTYTYTLAPKKKGQFTIGKASVNVEGKTIYSSPKTIKVTGDGKPRSKGQQRHQQPQQSIQRAGSAITNRDLFISVSANRKKIYEQEPILLTYKFYAQPSVMLSQIGIQKKPDFKGMLSQDIPIGNIYMEIEEKNGISYRSGVIQKYVIFPQGAGKVTVPGVTFNCDVMQRDVTLDPFEAFFNGGGTITRTVQRKVDDIQLNILPLPQPRPANFSGGVGNFKIHGEMLTEEFKTNDVATYRITIEGSGNLKLISAPQLELSDDFDVYSPKTTEKTSISEKGTTGKMIYEYTFVPRKVGEYELPAVQLTYFDPSAEKYKTVSTETVPLHVVKGERTNEEYQRSQNLQRSDIHDLHNSDVKTHTRDNYFWWGSFGYWLVYLLLIGVFMGISFLLQRFISANQDLVSLNSKRAGKMAKRSLKKAYEFMQKNKKSEFYTEVSHALYDYVAHKYNITLSNLNRSRIESELNEKGVTASSVSAFLKLLDECDFAQYAPSDQVMRMDDMYQQAIQTIIDIEKQK